MRVRRSIPQKPLTEEQKARALEAQKNLKTIQWPLTQSQMYQTQQSPIPSRGWYPFNKMNRSFMMDKKATFEEKYWVYDNVQQQQWTNVEFTWTPVLDVWDNIIPPSLEEDPNQSSPLPPDVHNASEEDDLDAFIKNAEAQESARAKEEEQAVDLTPLVQKQDPELWAATLQILEDDLKQLTVKQLKEEYRNKWWTRNIEFNNNKKSLINLILDLVINGAQQEESEDWWQDGSVD